MALHMEVDRDVRNSGEGGSSNVTYRSPGDGCQYPVNKLSQLIASLLVHSHQPPLKKLDSLVK